jgi:predicted site-specific integrase-resolvase
MPAIAAQAPAPGCLRSARQAADAYGINPYTICRWIRDGLISSYRVGSKLVMVDLDEINARMVRRVSSARDEAEAGQ